METVVVIAAIVIIGDWIFRQGKRLGSKKGYGVGVSRARSKRR